MADDLFGTWLPAIWTKARPDGTPPMYMMHRFLASDPDFAQAARVLQLEVREPELVFRIWQGLLPKETGAPRFYYVAPRKPAAEEALVLRVMEVEAVRRSVAETMVELLDSLGKGPDAYLYYGLEPNET